LATAFGDSDEEENDFDADVLDNRDEVEGPDSIDQDSIYQPSLPVVVADPAVLPDKIARYLYKYHADSYRSHDLPVLPADRSRTNVHGILKPHQVIYLFGNYLDHIFYLCYAAA
jgi:hypothetical protein